MRRIGEIGHEGIVVARESYNGDWEDHTIHIWDTVFRDGKLVLGIHGDDGSVLERPAMTLSEWEATELIELLARAIRDEPVAANDAVNGPKTRSLNAND
jgi:hypothetical protein